MHAISKHWKLSCDSFFQLQLLNRIFQMSLLWQVTISYRAITIILPSRKHEKNHCDDVYRAVPRFYVRSYRRPSQAAVRVHHGIVSNATIQLKLDLILTCWYHDGVARYRLKYLQSLIRVRQRNGIFADTFVHFIFATILCFRCFPNLLLLSSIGTLRH